MTEWISVENRLPNHWDKVNLKFNNGEENMGMRNPLGEGWIRFVKGTGTKVTHWAELPEAPHD